MEKRPAPSAMSITQSYPSAFKVIDVLPGMADYASSRLVITRLSSVATTLKFIFQLLHFVCGDYFFLMNFHPFLSSDYLS